MQVAKQAEAFELVHPHDRNGKAIADRHCTREVEEALNEYRAACDAARLAVQRQLKLLAITLQVCPNFFLFLPPPSPTMLPTSLLP